MKQLFLKAPAKYKYWFLAIALGFWIMGVMNTIRIDSPSNPPTDGTSEQLVGYSARTFARDGFWKTYLLPKYPPFGEGLDGKPRTEEFVYNHYLAGADITLGLWIKVFGESNVKWARLLPHTMTVAATVFLCLSIGELFGSALLACLMISGLMIARALTSWSICIYAHAYASAVSFFVLALCVRAMKQNQKKLKTTALAIQGVLGGFFVMWYAMDWVPGTFVAMFALSMAFLSRISRSTMIMGVGFAAGATLALIYQLTLSAMYFGSVGAVIEDLRQWLGLRTGVDALRGEAQFAKVHINHKLNYIIREFNKQAYGATGFTAFNLLGIGAGFVVLGFAAKIKRTLELKAGVVAMVLGYVSAAIWHTFMKFHAAGNMHFVVRHYLLLLVVTLAVVFVASLELIDRKRLVVN